jgi:uncharacterized protein (UPF0248 family)
LKETSAQLSAENANTVARVTDEQNPQHTIHIREQYIPLHSIITLNKNINTTRHKRPGDKCQISKINTYQAHNKD